jgi:undecaprenyl-diphosphatase
VPLSHRRQLAALAGTTGFLLLARKAADGTVMVYEERWFRAVNQITSSIRLPLWAVMQAGSLAAVPVAALAIKGRSRSTAAGVAVAGTTVWALSKGTKKLVRRGRPADHLEGVNIRGTRQRGLGFPSGHAAVATVLAAVGSRVLPADQARLAWAAAAVVGGTRQYVGAHLPLDVAGGTALGVAAGAITNLALDAMDGRRVELCDRTVCDGRRARKS